VALAAEADRKPEKGSIADMELVGQQLGAYRILSLLGRGGTAEVYKAFHPALKREVAVKVLLAEVSHDADWVRRFRQEAELLGRLDHPHILPIYDAGEHDGRPYLVMKYMGDSRTLRTVLSGRPWPLNKVVKIVGQVADALDAAHRAGVVHRDIKPSNILVTPDLKCLVFDFGIAKPYQRDQETTGSGLIVGTPEFMSPEQCKGDRIDHRSDVYSLGVLTYQMLTGHVPFQAETAVGILMKHLTEPLPIPPRGVALPPAVNGVLERAMAREPDRRYDTAGNFGDAFTKSADQRATVTLHPTEIRRATTPTLRLPGWVRVLRARKARLGFATVVLLGMVGAMYAMWPFGQADLGSSPERPIMRADRSAGGESSVRGPITERANADPLLDLAASSTASEEENGEATGVTTRSTDSDAIGRTEADARDPLTLPGALEIHSSQRAQVWLDGRAIGTAPGTFEQIQPGRHVLKLDAGDGHYREESVDVMPGSTHTLRFDLAASSPSEPRSLAAATFGAGLDRTAGGRARSSSSRESYRQREMRTWSGFLTDEDCGATGGKQGVLHLRCAERCIREGKAPMLYSRGRLYRLDGLEQLTVHREGPLTFQAWLERDTLHVVPSTGPSTDP
jgi:hypothetical protein